MGKTSMALNLLLNTAFKEKVKTTFFNLGTLIRQNVRDLRLKKN